MREFQVVCAATWHEQSPKHRLMQDACMLVKLLEFLDVINC